MAFTFPDNPTLNQTYVSNNITWTFNGKGWVKTTSQAIVTTNTTASTSTTTGALRVAGGAGIAGNLNVGGTTYVTGDILPTSNNTVNIGSTTNRFGTVYLAANTIDIGGTTISTAPGGELVFTTQAGNVSLTANAINFLSGVANTSTNQGDLTVSGNVIANKVYSNSYFYANGNAFVSGGGSSSATYAKTYYWKGALTENVGSVRHYVPVTTGTINTINAYLATAGLTQSTAVVKKNGQPINTIIFNANTTSNLQTGLSIAVSSSDYLTVDITQSSSATDLYINFVYQG